MVVSRSEGAARGVCRMITDAKTRRVTSEVIDAVRPTIAMIQDGQGLPAGFWQDNYVLGFLYGQVTACMLVFGGTQMKPEDKGSILVEIFSALSNANGLATARRATKLTESNDARFQQAVQNGMLTVMYGFGRVKDEANDPNIARATEAAKSSSPAPTREEIAGHLKASLWQDEVKKRFGSG
jgi:hypothetical protein